MPSARRHASPSLFAPVTPGTWSLCRLSARCLHLWLSKPWTLHTFHRTHAYIANHMALTYRNCVNPLGVDTWKRAARSAKASTWRSCAPFARSVSDRPTSVSEPATTTLPPMYGSGRVCLCMHVVFVHVVFALRTLAPPLFVCTHTPPHAPHPTAAITHARPPGRQEEEQAIFFSELMSMGFTDEQIKMAVLVAETPDEIMEILMSQAGGGGGDDGW